MAQIPAGASARASRTRSDARAEAAVRASSSGSARLAATTPGQGWASPRLPAAAAGAQTGWDGDTGKAEAPGAECRSCS